MAPSAVAPVTTPPTSGAEITGSSPISVIYMSAIDLILLVATALLVASFIAFFGVRGWLRKVLAAIVFVLVFGFLASNRNAVQQTTWWPFGKTTVAVTPSIAPTVTPRAIRRYELATYEPRVINPDRYPHLSVEPGSGCICVYDEIGNPLGKVCAGRDSSYTGIAYSAISLDRPKIVEVSGY
jgi:hypothetical protein